MFGARHCTVGILRPVEVEASRRLSHLIQASGNTLDVGESEYSDQIEQAIDHIHDMTVEAAAALGMKVSITGYQLHRELGTLHVMSRKRARAVHANTLLISVNPSPSEYSFVTGLRGEPLRRTVIAFTSAEALMDMSRLLGTAQTPIITPKQEETLHTVPRVFSVFIPPNEEDASERFQQSKTVVADALTYPHIRLQQEGRGSYMSLRKMDGDCLESQPAFRSYLVEAHTDRKRGGEEAA